MYSKIKSILHPPIQFFSDILDVVFGLWYLGVMALAGMFVIMAPFVAIYFIFTLIF